MEMNTKDLTGAALRWAAAKAAGERVVIVAGEVRYPPAQFSDESVYCPDSDWAQGGPILAQENISIDNRKGEPCRAFKGTPAHYEFSMFAPEGEPLVAAVRCFVASRLGEVVDIPEELHESAAPARRPRPWRRP